MREMPFNLRYALDRRQRFIPHTRIWGMGTTVSASLMFIVLVIGTLFCIMTVDPIGTILLGILAFLFFILYGRFFSGLLEIIITPIKEMDVTIGKMTAGILIDGERWMISLDGIISINRFQDDIWTLQHESGTVLNIPVSILRDDEIYYIQKTIELGCSEDIAQTMIEHNNQISHILNNKEEA
ncbi:hypothetical protein JYT61_00560 [bacterium AH-315-E10]|nr:hypothetical protein [bacterium AH-315-E10]